MFRNLSAAFLFGLMLLLAGTVHACGFVGSASYVGASYASYSACYAPSVVVVPQVAYVAAYAYVPAAYTSVQSYAAPCPQYVQPAQLPAAPAYAPEAMPYTSAVPVTTQETAYLQSYALPRAVSYLTSTYGCSADAALATLRVIGHQEAVLYHGSASTLIVRERSFGQRSFFRSDAVVVHAPGVRVEAGRRSFFGARAEARASRPRNVFTKSVTRTRTRTRIG